METRVCPHCGREMPFTEEYFRKSSRKKLISTCKDCYNAKKRARAAERKANEPEWYERELQKHRDYYEENKERIKPTMKAYRKAHPEMRQESFNKRRRIRMKEDPVFAWSCKARRAVRYVAMNKGKYDNRSSQFIQDLTGMTTLQLHYYLLGTFKETYGYEWDGVEKTHIDHIIPLCTESTIEGKQKLYHYSNLRLIKECDNRAKGMSTDYQIGA